MKIKIKFVFFQFACLNCGLHFSVQERVPIIKAELLHNAAEAHRVTPKGCVTPESPSQGETVLIIGIGKL